MPTLESYRDAATGAPLPLNAYALDYLKHASKKDIVKANGMKEGTSHARRVAAATARYRCAIAVLQRHLQGRVVQ